MWPESARADPESPATMVLIDLGTDRGEPDGYLLPTRRTIPDWFPALMVALLVAVCCVGSSTPPAPSLSELLSLPIQISDPYVFTDDGMLLVHTPAVQRLSGYDLSTGRMRWQAVAGVPAYRVRFGAGLVLLRARIATGPDIGTIALSAATGQPRWQVDGSILTVAGASTVLEVSEVRSIAGDGRRVEGPIIGLDPDTGRPRWTARVESSAVLLALPGPSLDRRSSDPRSSESRVTDPRSPDPRQSDPRLSDPRLSIARPSGQRPSGQRPSDRRPPGQGGWDPSQLDPSQLDQSQLGQSRYDQGQVDQGQVDQGQVDQGQVDQGQVDQGQVDHGQYRLSSVPRLLVVHASGLAELLDIDTGRRLAATQFPAADYGPGDPGVIGGMLLLRHPEGGTSQVSAYDPVTLRRQWHRATEPAYDMLACGELACLVGPAGVQAFDPIDGALRWYRPGWRTVEQRGGVLLAYGSLRGDTDLVGIVDADTSRVSVSLTDWRPMVGSGGDHLLVTHTDAADGRTLLAVAAPGVARPRLIGELPAGVGDCRAARFRLACRSADGRLIVWAYSWG